MLSVIRYNPGRYPPGPRFPQFGGNQLGGTVSATEEARGKLAAKRQRMAQFHTDRLEHDGFMPMHRPGHTPEDVFMAPPDAEEPTMHAASGHPPPPPPAGRTTRDTGTDPDRPDADEMDVDLRGDYPPQPPQPRMKETGTDPHRPHMEEIGVQSGGGPPPPPPQRQHMGTNTEQPRSDAGTQASFQPPPDDGYGQRRRRSRSPAEAASSSNYRPPPSPPGGGGVLAPVYRQETPDDVLMVVAHDNKPPPPPPGGRMEVDRVVERKRRPESDIGEILKDQATAAARSRRKGELTKREMGDQYMVERQQSHLNDLQRQKEAEAEAARNHKRSVADLQHQRDVAVSAAARGRQPATATATIAYPRPESVATKAYPIVQRFNIASRSRSPLLPTGSARSVSSGTHSVGTRSDAMTAFKPNKPKKKLQP